MSVARAWGLAQTIAHDTAHDGCDHSQSVGCHWARVMCKQAACAQRGKLRRMMCGKWQVASGRWQVAGGRCLGRCHSFLHDKAHNREQVLAILWLGDDVESLFDPLRQQAADRKLCQCNKTLLLTAFVEWVCVACAGEAPFPGKLEVGACCCNPGKRVDCGHEVDAACDAVRKYQLQFAKV